MAQDDKTSKLTATFKEIAANMILAEALFEVLVEKGLVTGEEILDRVKKLESERSRWVQ